MTTNVISILQKKCSKCEEFKDKDIFKGNSYCPPCKNKYARELPSKKEAGRRYYLANKVKITTRMSKYRKDNPEKCKAIADDYYKSPEGKFKRYQKDAKQRGISWGLTFEQFMTFWQKPCYYTGMPIETIGLDRVDSDKGYDMTNVVPCCGIVNWMKNDLHQEDFLKICLDIVKNLNLITLEK